MTELSELTASWMSGAKSICVGRIVEINAERRALVDFPGNQSGPVEARFVSIGYLSLDANALSNALVLLVFENGDPALPIIIGPIVDSLPERRTEVAVAGRNVVLEAREEVLLRCGESSLSLKKDGKIVVKGSQIVSRASRSNKIRGASVDIN